MLFFGVFSALLVVASATPCDDSVKQVCSNSYAADIENSCSAKYGAIDHHEVTLQSFVNANINMSFEFLLMSTYYGNYEAQREGFKGLYRKYSDKMWEDAIDVIKYIAKRDGKMNFEQPSHINISKNVFALDELSSLAKALDSQKQLAKHAMDIHAQTKVHDKYDASIAHYIEEQFLESLTDRVRELAGYTSDLRKMLNKNFSPLSMYLFDEYLKNSL